MIDLLFYYGSETVIVRVIGTNVFFGSSTFGGKLVSLDGLYLDYQSVIKEFPDLKDDKLWKNKAIDRLREHIKNINDEDKIADYIIDELKKKGYIPKLKQKGGFRAISLC